VLKGTSYVEGTVYSYLCDWGSHVLVWFTLVWFICSSIQSHM